MLFDYTCTHKNAKHWRSIKSHDVFCFCFLRITKFFARARVWIKKDISKFYSIERILHNNIFSRADMYVRSMHCLRQNDYVVDSKCIETTDKLRTLETVEECKREIHFLEDIRNLHVVWLELAKDWRENKTDLSVYHATLPPGFFDLFPV